MPSLGQGKGAGKAMCDGSFSPGITTDTSTAIFTGTYHVIILTLDKSINIDLKKHTKKRISFNICGACENELTSHGYIHICKKNKE